MFPRLVLLPAAIALILVASLGLAFAQPPDPTVPASPLGARYTTVYLPDAPAATGASYPNSMTEGFEGAWPATGWTLSDQSSTDGGEFKWGARSCHPHTGSSAGWSVGGGVQGSLLNCGASYASNLNTWARYGPFDLSNATSASLKIYFWGTTEYDSECKYDYFYVGHSADGNSFNGSRGCGSMTNGTEGNGYYSFTLDLAPRLGLSQVYVALLMVSDSSVSAGGVMIDDIVLTSSGSGAITSTPTPTYTPPQPGTATSTPTYTPVEPDTPTPTSTSGLPHNSGRVTLPLILVGWPLPTPTPTNTPPPTNTSTPSPTPTVTPTPSPTVPGSGPQDGEWQGLTSQNQTIKFSVTNGGKLIPKMELRILYGGRCGINYATKYWYDIPVQNGSFSKKASDGSEITGAFGTTIAVNGTWKEVFATYYPSYCTLTLSGTWSGQAK